MKDRIRLLEGQARPGHPSGQGKDANHDRGSMTTCSNGSGRQHHDTEPGQLTKRSERTGAPRELDASTFSKYQNAWTPSSGLGAPRCGHGARPNSEGGEIAGSADAQEEGCEDGETDTTLHKRRLTDWRISCRQAC